MCALCGVGIESNTHLFLHSPAVWVMWSEIMNREGVIWAIPNSLAALAAEWSSLLVVSDGFLWNLTPYALVWTSWLSRNDILFNNRTFNAHEVWDLHLLKVSRWTKNCWKECPFDSSFFLSNIFVCKFIPPPTVAVWHNPSFGTPKFNVDGASQGNLGPSGFGEVVRNHNKTLWVTSQKVRVTTGLLMRR